MLRRALDAALGLLYPERCVSCGAFGRLLCDTCRARRLTPALGPGRCPNCAAAWDQPLNCPRCQSLDALDRCLAAYEMDGAARQAVHALKYLRIRAIAPEMAVAMAPVLALAAPGAVFAVPLHPGRLRSRGFNQAELLLGHLSLPPAPGRLVRVRNTRQQVGQRERERRGNVAGAFRYDGPPLDGLTVALLDDVITTGSTMNECARVLRDHGARTVAAVAYARASYLPGAAIRD